MLTAQLPRSGSRAHARRRVQAQAQPAARGARARGHRRLQRVLVRSRRAVLPRSQPRQPRVIRKVPRHGGERARRRLRRPPRELQVLQHGPGVFKRARNLRRRLRRRRRARREASKDRPGRGRRPEVIDRDSARFASRRVASSRVRTPPTARILNFQTPRRAIATRRRAP